MVSYYTHTHTHTYIYLIEFSLFVFTPNNLSQKLDGHVAQN